LYYLKCLCNEKYLCFYNIQGITSLYEDIFDDYINAVVYIPERSYVNYGAKPYFNSGY